MGMVVVKIRRRRTRKVRIWRRVLSRCQEKSVVTSSLFILVTISLLKFLSQTHNSHSFENRKYM